MRESSVRNVVLGALLAILILFYVSRSKKSLELTIQTSLENTLNADLENKLPVGCNLDNFVLDKSLDHGDSCLLAFFKKNMLVQPRSPDSLKTIPFSYKEVDVPCNIDKLKWVQMMVIDGAPKDTQFFFVDSGAHDGRYLSTTVRLETLFGWNGVLVEPQPKEFQKLIENRGVWAVNAALCVTSHPDYVNFYVSGNSVSSILGSIGTRGGTKVRVPCVPLYTILTALDVNVVDFLSLDLEGAELLVLKTIPFDEIMFKLIIVEYAHNPGKNPFGQIVEFMEPQGYHLVANITMQWSADCVFVHESIYQEKKGIIKYLNTI